MDKALTVSFLGFQRESLENTLTTSDLATIRLLAQYHPELSLVIEGLPCEDYSGYVEDDLEELVSAYSRLEHQISSAEYGAHTVFFGQGGLVLAADVSPDTTMIELERSPHLDKRFTTKHKLEVPTEDYLRSWRRVLHTLLRSSRSLGT